MLALLALPVTPAPSFRIVPLPRGAPAASRSNSLVEALQHPSVSVAVLKRDDTGGEHASWTPLDVSASLPLSQALTARSCPPDGVMEAFRAAPDHVRSEICELLRLFAMVAREAGGASSDTLLNCRLVVASEQGRCPRLHYDKVALRLSVALCGEGTRWLAESAINRAGYAALRHHNRLPSWLQQMLLQPRGWMLYNAFLRWPWCAERRTMQSDCLFMKGSGWRYGLRHQPLRFERRALPALHRSPVGGFYGSDEKSPRVLFTVDFA
ncbi:hypothetical protein AB1Y20_003906 [Prymnesium parvum]|uniref:Uncharacterized protein n=1 Tax=Prymnesium parvum TaxID=97485 RepID=A0AB34J807_PRYPA